MLDGCLVPQRSNGSHVDEIFVCELFVDLIFFLWVKEIEDVHRIPDNKSVHVILKLVSAA
jgi:hypothetical protein